jgi:hypothetical protein
MIQSRPESESCSLMRQRLIRLFLGKEKVSYLTRLICARADGLRQTSQFLQIRHDDHSRYSTTGFTTRSGMYIIWIGDIAMYMSAEGPHFSVSTLVFYSFRFMGYQLMGRICDHEGVKGGVWTCENSGHTSPRQRRLIRARPSDLSPHNHPVPGQADLRSSTIKIFRATYPDHASYLKEGDMIWCSPNSEIELWDDGSGFVITFFGGETDGVSPPSPYKYQIDTFGSGWKDLLTQTCHSQIPSEAIPSQQLLPARVKRQAEANQILVDRQPTRTGPVNPSPKRTSQRPTPLSLLPSYLSKDRF